MSDLHLALAHRIVDHLKDARPPVGEHLVEQELERLLGASRSPIRGALGRLAELGLVERRPNRGYFLARDPADMPLALPASPDQALYLAIARWRLSGRAGATLAEAEAIRAFGVSRAQLRRVLLRIAEEGWIERRPGQGWAFLPMIDSVAAYDASYAFRMVVEPAGILLPSFEPDTAVLTALREVQAQIVEDGYLTLPPQELYRLNAAFHAAIAAMSGNAFIRQAVERQNVLRRLVEYEEIVDRDRVREQCREHLAILDTLQADDRGAAAEAMRRHLDRARRAKVEHLTRGGVLA